MSFTLYRKYRPQKFSEVIAQNHIKVTLENEITSGKIAHAYLFSGPRGIGKTTIARIFAKSLNCQNRVGAEPCNECVSCLEIGEGRSLDLVEIDAASNRGINEIRELKEQIKYTPVKSKYKIFIIDEVHMLTAEAFNALLKTLEEPPAYAIFILATTEAHKLPDTIISRCQRFDFKKVPFSDIVAHLGRLSAAEGIDVEKKVLENVARISEGYLRDALSLLGQIVSLGEKHISEAEASLVLPKNDWQKTLELLTYLFKKQTRQALSLVTELSESGSDLEHFTQITLETIRKFLLGKVTGDWQDLYWEFGEDQAMPVAQLAQNVREPNLVYMIEIFLETVGLYKQARIIQLPLEIAIIKIIEHLGGDDKNDDFKAPPTRPNPLILTQTKPEDASSDKTDEPASVSFEEIKIKWPEVIEALKEHNYSLSAAVKIGLPVELKVNKIVLGFQYKFHYERLKEKKNLEKIEEVLLRVYQNKFSIAGDIDEKYATENPAESGQKNDSMIKDVLEVLGGEVVG